MDENHQNSTGSKLTTTDDVTWVVSKKSKLLVPQHMNQRRKIFNGKVPFDWLNLLGVLAIPFVIAFGTSYFTQQITQQQTDASNRQHQVDLQIASDQQEESTLQTYLDDMSSLMLNNKLRESKSMDEVRELARARTWTTLRRLDSIHKGVLLRFLYEAGLIGVSIEETKIDQTERIRVYNPIETIVSLNGANLSFANLKGATLARADLSYANLFHANLSYGLFLAIDLHGAYLVNADLSHADLRGANVSNEQLAQATSLQGTIMPDGSIHS